MKERLDLERAVRDALPVYEATPELRDWVRKEARKLDQESVSERGLMTPARARFSGSYPLRIAAGLVIAAFVGWGIGSLRPIGALNIGIMMIPAAVRIQIALPLRL